METIKNQPRVAERCSRCSARSRTSSTVSPSTSFTHALQTATRAERAGADTQVIVASLLHDVGKAVSVANHPAIAAEILRPYVRDEGLLHDPRAPGFSGKALLRALRKRPTLREKHRTHPAFALTERFVDDWDQAAFDPAYPTLPLEHFEPMVREVFRMPRASEQAPAPRITARARLLGIQRPHVGAGRAVGDAMQDAVAPPLGVKKGLVSNR